MTSTISNAGYINQLFNFKIELANMIESLKDKLDDFELWELRTQYYFTCKEYQNALRIQSN